MGGLAPRFKTSAALHHRPHRCVWGLPCCVLTAVLLGACGGAGPPALQSQPSIGHQGSSIGSPEALSQTPVPSAAGANCPKEAPLPLRPDARQAAIAAVEATVTTAYENIDTHGYRITGAWPAGSRNDPLSEIPGALCGQLVRERTCVVTLFFPAMLPSADLSQGQDFVADFTGGWRVWFRYH